MLTDMCAGDRGVLQITMPNKSRVGAAFTHITQMMWSLSHELPCVQQCRDGDLYVTADSEADDNDDDCM